MNAKPHEVQLNGLRLAMSQPRVIAETPDQLGGRCWFPDLLKFSTGELMLTHSLNPDANDNLYTAQAVRISTDHGRTWDFAYDVNGFHNAGGEPRISLPDGRIVGTSTFLKPDPQGDKRRFVAHWWTYDHGGHRYSVEPWGATVSGLPRDVPAIPNPSRTWWNRINWFSDIIRLKDEMLTSTLSLRFDADERESTVAVVSVDGGRNWKYLSTIANADAVPDATEGFDEPCLVQLKTGELMCVSRVGSGENQKLARTYSRDNGKTWSPVDRLPAYSVAPQICLTANGTLVLSTGRPGVSLWFSTDDRGKEWQSFDVAAHHNSTLDKRFHIVNTTSYTGLVEVEPNRCFLVYDQLAYNWEAVPADSTDRSRIFLMEVQVERC